MRLKNLKVSGFKSFVDVTDIRLPGNLVGVVGPNGCGKSNVIDAVRWVMGEASAKMLRGDNMADVIFNGSSSRKPVGKASVELVFDNSEGKASGNYSQFAEISIRRTLSRDGQSSYFVNNIKSRRKDVLDLFRGTGLGPRSYSIIEQGMVSRIVEARPDELRVFVEEAAGTSKYKDRRRETEVRIRHTRENLERVEDIRNELDKQLRRLQRQSSAARRFKVLKEEEREMDGQLQVLRLRALEQQLGEQDRLSAQLQNAMDEALATQRRGEAELEQLRKHQGSRQRANNEIQQAFYTLGAEIRNVEQRVEHLTETRKRQGEEIQRLENTRKEHQSELESDTRRLEQFGRDVGELAPQLQRMDSELTEAEAQQGESERVLQRWQQNWEEFNNASRQPAQQKEVQSSRIQQLERHLKQTRDRHARLEQELGGFRQNMADADVDSLRNKVVEHDQALEQRETRFQQQEQELQGLRDAISEKRDQTAELRARQQEVSSRLRSLKEIQQAALGSDDDALQAWLNERGIDGSSRLAKKVRVQPGWERAADRVLSDFLGAICLDVAELPELTGRPETALTIVSGAQGKTLPPHARYERLIDKVSAGGTELAPLLADVYVADDLDSALAMQGELFGRDCAVSRDGALVGANWVSLASDSQLETGVLVREEEIKQLDTRLSSIEIELENRDRETTELEQQRDEVQTALQQQRGSLNQMRAEKTSLHNRLGREEARMLEIEQRSTQIANELTELATQIDTDTGAIDDANRLLDQAESQAGTVEERRRALLEEREKLNQDLAGQRQKVGELRDRRHQTQLEKQRIESAMESVREHLRRIRQQLDATSQRLQELGQSKVEEGEDPIEVLRSQLAGMLDQRIESEKKFAAARDEMADIENRIAAAEKSRIANQDIVNDARERLDEQRLGRQEVVVRTQTQKEHVGALGTPLAEMESTLPEQASIKEWENNLAHVRGKIDRIGPVNLVAIDEFEEQSTRKEYLDNQHADLVEALDTLESVIRKIDRETRSRFQETFEKLNAGFNDFFPRLFGGGKADLQLTSDDFLTAGVTVMARPPGKRNSTIHLLSGGEKALTAVALLFSLFRLNPAPFCMLDEVDAPLDDANVDRYCNTLKTLAEISQIVVITHNKITMEAADLLVGVTMAEPGVSRLVSVDIKEAVEMAAQ